ncbi:MAG: hypothetical protein H6705_04020 [Myxococcales bacterium]|nr:hypothetical protein [Myxococcales bacterium]
MPSASRSACQHGHAPYRGRDGMGCFIHGDYGCKTTLGLMIAPTPTRAIPSPTRSFPRSPKASASPTTRTPPPSSRSPDIDPPSSSHRRIWHYANGNAPGDIRLLHIWLTR